MKTEQRKHIIDRHRDSLTRYGHHPNALFWSSREIQEIRFRVLCEIGIEADSSVLDVGCGFADFKSWFEGQGDAGQSICYTGIDLCPDLIQVAQNHHPEAKLLCGELFDFHFEDGSFDWVIVSGAMNEQLHDDGAYARQLIAAMFKLCGKGLAFNLLDVRQLSVHGLQSFEPQAMMDYCRGLCPDVQLMDDYLTNDFSIYMRH